MMFEQYYIADCDSNDGRGPYTFEVWEFCYLDGSYEKLIKRTYSQPAI